MLTGCFEKDIPLKENKVLQKNLAANQKLEILYDKNTQLTWQDNNETKSIKKEWQGAKEYCQNLTIGKYSDWRLPNYTELISIIDYKERNPSISRNFKNILSFYYWSSSELNAMNSQAWIVGFFNGNTYFNNKSEKYNIRCVRGIKSFKKSNLVWEEKSSKKGIEVNWDNANSYCSNLVQNGASNWRLPSIQELQVSEDDFKNVFHDSYWSVTQSAWDSNIAWRVNFGSAYTITYKKSMKGHTRCVRSR